MKGLLSLLFFMITGVAEVYSNDFPIPYNIIEAPVIHSGKYNVLSCGETFAVLDGSAGMSIAALGRGNISQKGIDNSYTSMKNIHLEVTVSGGEKTVDLNQSFDSSASLQIIDQSENRVAARAFFVLRSKEGIPYGSGTMDIFVYDGRIHFIPSIHIDSGENVKNVVKAGLFADVNGSGSRLLASGVELMAKEKGRFLPFGAQNGPFSITIDNASGSSLKIGWLRNEYPSWMYLCEIDSNPETDELYERWPEWVTQRGAVKWNMTPGSGLNAEFGNSGVQQLSFSWSSGDTIPVPAGGYLALNGTMGIFIAPNAYDAESQWSNHEKPVKPVMTTGEYKYYNEFEGIYEIDSGGKDVEFRIDNLSNTSDRNVFIRVWNLKDKNAFSLKVNNRNWPLALYNDGDIIDDPMVPIIKEASGPARFAGIFFNVLKGSRSTVKLSSVPGMQFTYQMYSPHETWEAWTAECTDTPLFRFHKNESSIYQIVLPGKNNYAIAKFPLFWLKNGVNTNTFMTHPRTFKILKNGPESIDFEIVCTNLQGTGLSDYIVKAPFSNGVMKFDVSAEFTPLDDGKRWSSVEYCDLYPFDNVYRRTFHYKDVIFLDRNGVFDRVGTGAWGSRFVGVPDSLGNGYYAKGGSRDGAGSRVPNASDGTVWLLGNNTDRGNILYRRGDWTPSSGATSAFTLCNAWVDIHNTVVNRQDPKSKELINYTVEVFPGAVPSIDSLNEIYSKAAGGKTVKQLTSVKYDKDGSISGFEVKK